MIAGRSKSCRILRAIKRIGKKHPTEKHDLGDQENPHAQRARLALLFQVLEVMLQRRVACLMFNCNAVCQLFSCQLSSNRSLLLGLRPLAFAFRFLPSAYCLLPSVYSVLTTSSLNLPTTCISSGGANSYASQVTTGVTRKFSVGGGEAVRHSSPGKCQGFASACLP